MIRFILIFLLAFATAQARNKSSSKVKSQMVQNAHKALKLYGLENQLDVGQVSKQNKRVVLCEPRDEKELFNFLNKNPDWRRDRYPNTGHKGRIWAFRTEKGPSLHLTLVKMFNSLKHQIEED